MKSKITHLGLLLIFCLATAFSTQAQQAPEWNLDKAHTTVTFDIKHFFNTVTGKFTDYSGEFYFDQNNLQASKFTFTIPVKSINTNNDKRDEHLRSEDFFHAEQYPNITFESRNFEHRAGENKYVAQGDLTIRGVTKRVNVPFEVTGRMDHPMREGTEVMGLSFNTSLDRTDYNVGVGDWASTAVVGDNVDVRINMELTRKK